MKASFHTILAMGAALGIGLASVPASANLIVNGGFEDPSNGYSTTATPPGWTNFGHSDGVIPYSMFATPAYEGDYYYDFGGFGDSNGPDGHGIQQTVVTTAGVEYELIFGLSSEDVAGDSVLRVDIDGVITDFPLTSTGTFLGKGFTTQSISFTALDASTTISFIDLSGTVVGNNDPMIDCVGFDVKGTVSGCGAVVNPTPEPASLALLGIGLVGLAGLRRRRG